MLLYSVTCMVMLCRARSGAQSALFCLVSKYDLCCVTGSMQGYGFMSVGCDGASLIPVNIYRLPTKLCAKCDKCGKFVI